MYGSHSYIQNCGWEFSKFGQIYKKYYIEQGERENRKYLDKSCDAH